MKKIFIYALTLIALAACTAEDAVVEEVLEPLFTQDPTSIGAVKVSPSYSGIQSRSSLHYDKFAGTIAMFEWDDADHIVVFRHGSDHIQPMEFKQQADNPGNTLTFRYFESLSNSIKHLAGNTKYVAFAPYPLPAGNGDFDGYSVDVTYRNQKQTGHVDMRHYFDTKDVMTADVNAQNYKDYVDSERAASAHLSTYDYLCSAPITTRAMGGVEFPLERMGAVVRFYIKYPVADYVYTELQLYNPDVEFTLDATINVNDKSMAAKGDKEAKSHVMKLQFEEKETSDGFDIGVAGNTNPFYKYGGTNAYLIAYMMMAPVDLSAEETSKSTLYLIAHEKNAEKTVHYYKATLSTKPNLKPNDFYQWSPTYELDTPIEFTETTVEDWKQTEGYSNGEGGTGTSGW